MCPLGPLDDLLARCPACCSILASDHLPSNPLVFAFWVVANGRLDCIILEKSQWDSDTIFVLLKNNVTFSVIPSPPLTYTMLKLGKKFWSTCVQTCLWGFSGRGGEEEMGMRFLKSSALDFAQTSILFVGRDVCKVKVNWLHSVSVSSIAPTEQSKTFSLL